MQLICDRPSWKGSSKVRGIGEGRVVLDFNELDQHLDRQRIESRNPPFICSPPELIQLHSRGGRRNLSLLYVRRPKENEIKAEISPNGTISISDALTSDDAVKFHRIIVVILFFEKTDSSSFFLAGLSPDPQTPLPSLKQPHPLFFFKNRSLLLLIPVIFFLLICFCQDLLLWKLKRLE